MPVFLFPAKNGTAYHHVYVVKDKACTNVIFNSAVIRGGAFAPRTAAPVNDGPVFTKSGDEIAPTESGRTDLAAGKYSWTVVSVERRSDGSYHDLEDVQSACQSQKGSLVKTTDRPQATTGKVANATGLSPRGKVVSVAGARSLLYGAPLVAWKPAAGASRYEVQWSHSEDPWQTVDSVKTYATSVTLPLKPGTWWYRVRGLDSSIRGNQQMRWSAPVAVQIARPTFSVVGT